jgi:GTP-binding protein
MIRDDIRNIAIIAHVDHGKTTLVDGMLKQSNVFRDASQAGERILDSNDLERERGITILAKNTAVTWGGVKVNIVDTPGHADFGGEVERVLNMVDGALLLVDAVEGPMPQTRFVLRKALELGLRIIVVINKIDRKYADPGRVLNDTFDLFIELGATDLQADFPIVYAVGLHGQAGFAPGDLEDNLSPLFDVIISELPGPQIDEDQAARMLVTTLDYSSYKGQIGVGRLQSGTLKRGMPVVQIRPDGERINTEIQYLFTHHNLERQEIDEAHAGDIIAFAGPEEIGISDTIAERGVTEALPAITVEQPTVRMTFGVNTSPFAGREGKTGWGTSRRLRERLYEETKHNVSLKVEDGDTPEKFTVSGRGELHLAILIETMRREGYEFEVSRPEVIFEEDADGNILEPHEEVEIEVADDLAGVVIEMMGSRRGLMQNMHSENGTTSLVYIAPTRGLLGLRSNLLMATSGMGTMHRIFHGYEEYAGSIPTRRFGSLVAWEQGTTAAYALDTAQERGSLFVGPGVEVYEGMIIGEHQRPGDLAINVCKTKHLTGHRRSFAEEAIRLTPPRDMSLDKCIEFLTEDELLEVTPENLRLRKKTLNNDQRVKEQKRKQQFEEAQA